MVDVCKEVSGKALMGLERRPANLPHAGFVTYATLEHERAYHDLWAFTGEFKTARQLVRALVVAQDRTNASAVY